LMLGSRSGSVAGMPRPKGAPVGDEGRYPVLILKIRVARTGERLPLCCGVLEPGKWNFSS